MAETAEGMKMRSMLLPRANHRHRLSYHVSLCRRLAPSSIVRAALARYALYGLYNICVRMLKP
jgi:hypothetical protein